MQVELADALERTDEEGVGAQPFALRLALDMALAEGRIELLQEGDLLAGEIDPGFGMGGRQRQPTVVAGAQAVVVEDLLDSDRLGPPSFRPQQRLQAVAAIGRVRERQRPDPPGRLRRRRLRV